jgi:cyanophycinase
VLEVPAEPDAPRHPGPLALLGGPDPCGDLDAELVGQAGAEEVTFLPTAAAYERPAKAVAAAESRFGRLGVRVRALDVLGRRDAEQEANASAVRCSRLVFLGDGSPLHLRSVLKGSRLWQALFDTWESGAAVAGAGAGAMVLTDPMLDPRGGAFTLGLGLVVEMSVVPGYEAESAERAHRTIRLAPPGIPVAGVPDGTALVREPDGTWREVGAGRVEVFVDGRPAGLEALPR